MEELPIAEVARRLNAALGPTLVVALSGTRERLLPPQWARHDGPQPDAYCAERLRVALTTFRTVADIEGEDIARAWFIGANPWLGDNSPVSAIREGLFAQVAAAARSLVEDGFAG